jgi:Zn-dependent metalloprotease
VLTFRILVAFAIVVGLAAQEVAADRTVEQTASYSIIASTDVAYAFLESSKHIYGLEDPRSELQLSSESLDRVGNRHLRFHQYYHDIPVLGGELVAHFTESSDLVTVNGHFEAGIELNPAPSITVEQAQVIVRGDLSDGCGQVPILEQELVVFPWLGENYLCHRLEYRSLSPICRWVYYVDGHTGNIVYKVNLIKSSSEIGAGYGVMGGRREHIDVWLNDGFYYMHDYSRQLNHNIHGHDGQMPEGNAITTYIAGPVLPGEVAVNDGNLWVENNLRPAVDAHVYAGLCYDWMLREFGRNSFDGMGGSMISSVDHTITQYSAWWIGSQVVYMAGNPYSRSYAACLDVVGHEWGHGVTEYTSDMVYRWETGALDEAFSDWFGTAFEWAHDTLDPPDYYIGENGLVYAPGWINMAAPEYFDNPHTYKGENWVPCEDCVPTFANDFCGVHTNCGVGHKWFYLLCEGGSFGGETINAIGIENAIQIAYHANAYYWTQTVDYLNGAIGTWFAANDLDPTGVWAAEVLAAWRAVGIDFDGAELAFHISEPIPRTLQLDETAIVGVTVTGNLEYEPVPGTGQIHVSENGGDFVALPMAQTADNQYQYELSASLCIQPTLYYFSAEAGNGQRRYYPSSDEPLSIAIVSRIDTAFLDDFEADKGWTVSGNATAGMWERGVPAGDGSYGEPATDFDGSGQCYLTGNNGSDEDVDAGHTDLISPTFDMNGKNGLVRFALWYNVRCAPAAGEVMWVYLSNNDGVSWPLAKFIGPQLDAHGGWLVHEFEVADIVEPTSEMKLIFRVVDWGFASCVEAGLDAVLVTRYVCEQPCCGLYGAENRTGNVDYDPANFKDISDILMLARYSLLGGDVPPCMAEANTDGDAECFTDISDILRLARYSLLGGEAPAFCLPECE